MGDRVNRDGKGHGLIGLESDKIGMKSRSVKVMSRSFGLFPYRVFSTLSSSLSRFACMLSSDTLTGTPPNGTSHREVSLDIVDVCNLSDLDVRFITQLFLLGHKLKPSTPATRDSQECLFKVRQCCNSINSWSPNTAVSPEPAGAVQATFMSDGTRQRMRREAVHASGSEVEESPESR